MKLNIDQLKKKIVYRSNYRGTKEMDKLLGAFTNTYIDKLNIDDLIDYFDEFNLNLSKKTLNYYLKSVSNP